MAESAGEDRKLPPPVAEKLPRFWNLACETASGLKKGSYSDKPSLKQSLMPLSNPDFIAEMESVIPPWRKIAVCHDGLTAVHTLLVLAACLNLEEYRRADLQTRQEIEWAAVLHDLDKQQARKDAAHPFRSAAAVAGILPGLGFTLQPGTGSDQLAGWSALVLSAQHQDGERWIHDHTRLAEIVEGIRRCWGEGTPASRVLKAVLFHQSLPTLEDWSNPVLMTDQELRAALTLKDMDVLGPLMLADSDSWNLFDEKRTAYLTELRASNAATCRRIDS